MSNDDAAEKTTLFEIPAGTQITPEYLFARYAQTIVDLRAERDAAIAERDRRARQNVRLKEIVRYFTGPYDKGCAYSAIESDPQTMGSHLLIKAGFLDDLLEEIEQFD